MDLNRNTVGINETEFKKIFDSLYKPLKNFIYYKCGDIAVAEDIVQDTFLKAWEKRETIQKETVQAYLYKIADNLHNNRYERNKLILKFFRTFKQKETTESPEYLFQVEEFNQTLQKALAELNEKNRVVFLMNRVDKLTYNEIAEKLGLSVKAIEKRMKNALDYLKKYIDVKI